MALGWDLVSFCWGCAIPSRARFLASVLVVFVGSLVINLPFDEYAGFLNIFVLVNLLLLDFWFVNSGFMF